MHGEYKVPGGKLVVVDAIVIADQIRQVAISGDFFLAPDEAIEWMRAALEGLPASTPPAEVAQRVAEASAGAELIGITPEGVAEALRRALETREGPHER